MEEIRIRIDHITDTSTVSSATRSSLLIQFDAIANLIWRKPSDIFQRLESWVFASDTGLLLAHTGSGELVGFSVYRRLTLGSARVIHRETTNVIPAVQGRGVWTALTRRLLLDLATGAEDRPLHVAFRTRNPIVYIANYKLCEAIVPDLLRTGPADPGLENLALRAAQQVYPQLPVHLPWMVMLNAYAGAGYHAQPDHRSPEINARFFDPPGLEEPASALFVLGRLRVR